ncbi:fungal-specific transcription factor domain-containing protein [Armillaria fumosa]|nr:fungal-specific transcription factor domain-containing protein [Armillaria fumosa]
MKCNFAPGEQACQRCKPKSYHCVVEAPKPKVYECERLLTEIRQKDAIIETLLKQLHNPYLATSRSIDEYVKSISPSDVNNPMVLDVLSRLKSSVQIGIGTSSTEGTGEGDSGRLTHDQHYNLHPHSEAQEHEDMPTATIESSCVPVGFRPECETQGICSGPGVFYHYCVSIKYTHVKLTCPGFRLGNSMGLNYPEILVLGLVTLDDAEQLFDIFYKYINPLVSILDPILHTPKSTLARCPVLFTVICAVASRYHPRKSGIYQIAMHLAKYSAANSLVQDDMKSVELCQAYILMSIYTVPETSWDRDQTWLYTGLAISIATALRLDRTAKVNSATENEEREYLNRVRVWKFCFLLDQGIAIQVGKPWMMKEDTIICQTGEWYRQSLHNLDYDVFLCGYNVLLRIVARFHKEVLLSRSGLINSERGNLRDAIMRYDAEIEIFKEEWQKKFKVGGGAMVRCRELHFYVAYFKLVIFSFGFHQVFHAGIEAWYDYFFTKSFEYAKSVIRCMNEDLAPSGCMRYAPDWQFMYTAFAVVFLFKLLRPEFSYLLDKADKDEIIKLIGILINKFNSSDIAVDNRHTPKLYARFLASLLGKYQHSGQGTTFGSSQTLLPEHADTSMNIAGETNGENSDRWQRPSVAQEYDSATFTFTSEVTHAPGSWSTQFETDIEFYNVMNGNQNINGNGGVGIHPGIVQDETLMSIQRFDHPESLQGMLMPGYGFPSLPM